MVEEVQQLVGDDINGFDQEVRGPGGRVQHLHVEDPLDQVGVLGIGLVGGEAPGIGARG